MKLVVAAMHREVRILSDKRSIPDTADEKREAYRMIAGYIATRDDAEDIRWVADWLLVTGVEEHRIAGVEAHCHGPDLKVSRDATLFDREIGHSVIAIRFQSLLGG